MKIVTFVSLKFHSTSGVFKHTDIYNCVFESNNSMTDDSSWKICLICLEKAGKSIQ